MYTDLDFDAVGLLSPISESNSCGVDCRYDMIYTSLHQARQAETGGLPNGVWERIDVRGPDWVALEQQCTSILRERSKDLQVAAWLVEALLHQHRLAGLVEGVKFFVALTIKYWEGVHPLLEEGDAAMRIRPVEWLMREWVRWDRTGKLSGSPPPQGDSGGISQHWITLQSSLTRLEDFLVEKVGTQAPSFREISTLVGDRLRESTRFTSTENEESMLNTGNSFGNERPTGARDRAYDELHKISEILAGIEPHSPVPGILQAIVGWRHARFEQLIHEFPQDGPSLYELARFFKARPRT